MDMIKESTSYLNPGQTPIITADQPLYALAKEIQWNLPDAYGEDKFIVMFGPLHIEMGVFKALGDWLDGSGWDAVLSEAKVARPGVAQSCVDGSHLTRTRHAHQVTAAALHHLQNKAYESYLEQTEGNILSKAEWVENMSQSSPQFKYWNMTLELELLAFTFVRSIRTGNFQLYTESLAKLVPWFFALDKQNYARWLSVHVRDLVSLGQIHPDIATEFQEGKFVVHKTMRTFSAIAADQAHEQNNAHVKGEGGAVGLTDSPNAFRRWMVAGPEVARLLDEYTETWEQEVDKIEDCKHHEQIPSEQVRFNKQVKALANEMEDMGNPFLEESKDLIALDTKNITDEAVVKTIDNIQALGKQQYETFTTERFVDKTKSLKEPIKRNKMPLFITPSTKKKTKTDEKVKSLKHDRTLFSRLYIACQTREGSLQEFFSYENQASPPSLSDAGKLYHGTKSDIVECITPKLSTPTEGVQNASQAAASDGQELLEGEDTPIISQGTVAQIAADPIPVDVDVTILDGAAIVNMIKPDSTSITFGDYADKQFVKYIDKQKGTRVDLVFDEYISNSLKASERSNCGKGIRRRVMETSNIPRNWQQFLRDERNKKELFAYLSNKAVSYRSDKDIYATKGTNVMVNHDHLDKSRLIDCTQEEADTRIFLHAYDAGRNGLSKILIRTVDSDVIVIAVSTFQKLGISELWISYNTGASHKYLPIHEIASSLGPTKAKALPFFHAFTGCDTVSAFQGKGKCRAWQTWKVFMDASDIFVQLSETPSAITDEALEVLEKFVIVLYDRTSADVRVNDSRRHLFTNKGRAIENIPPTQAALLEHSRRAAYQAGHCWAQCLIPNPMLPDPSKWGWQDDNGTWKPLWTVRGEAMKSMLQLLHCGCKKGCRGRCKCVNTSLRCTALCACDGQCVRD